MDKAVLAALKVLMQKGTYLAILKRWQLESAATKERARKDSSAAHRGGVGSRTRARATRRALKREGSSAASRGALAKQAKVAARRRPKAARVRAALKAARTRRRRKS